MPDEPSLESNPPVGQSPRANPSFPPRWFGNPWVGFIGTFASILGVGLSVWLYFAGVKRPQLTYLVNSVRTTIVNSKEASAVRVLYNDKELKSDVTSVAVAIWNRGRAAIHSQNVQRPLTIRLLPVVPILEVRLSKPERHDITNTHVDNSRLVEGIVTLKWNILEQNDGTIVQLVYAGGLATRVIVSATIEEQGKIIDAHNTTSSSIPLYPFIVVLAITSIVVSLRVLRRRSDANEGPVKHILRNVQDILYTLVVSYLLILVAYKVIPGMNQIGFYDLPSSLGGPSFIKEAPPIPPNS
jgi:hypothetical protein